MTSLTESEPITFRRATAEDSATLSAIAREAKAYWGYPQGLLDLWSADLTVSPAFIAGNYVLCACVGDAIVGFAAVCAGHGEYELEHMWVRPEHMRRGVGRRLLAHVTCHARECGISALRIISDPHAEAFYTRAGARRVGDVESTPEGRRLPLLALDLQQDADMHDLASGGLQRSQEDAPT